MRKLDQKLKHRALHRAKILQGQMAGIIKMIEQEDYCPLILRQTLSIQHSLKSLNEVLLENHLKTHVVEQMKHYSDNKAVKELIEIYHLANN